MDKLWLFSETGYVFAVPDAESIVDDSGSPRAGAEGFRCAINNAAEFAAQCERADQIILVSSQKPFDPQYLTAIPSHLPRLALIKSDTPTDTGAQFQQLEVDAFVFIPFTQEAVNASIKKSFDDKNSLLALQEELRNYSNIAFTAMSSASEMGVVAFYAQAVQNTSAFDRLAQQTLRCLNDLSVQGFIQFTFDDSIDVYPQDASAKYRNLLGLMRSSPQRIISQGRFLIFNFENAQLLVSDAPVDNPDKYGRLRDVIAHIASIAEARAKTIKVNSMLKVQQDNTRMVMMLLEMASQDNRNSVKTIMTDLSVALHEMALGLDLTLEQERSMLELSERALAALEGLHEATDKIEVHFRSLVLQLDQAAKLLESDDKEEKVEVDTSVELF